ncbi:MAG: nitrile hydratase subunit beta [Roseobacter sp.]|jgi:nitrile hydratase
MTRPHDMGGRFGDGPVDPDPEEKVFKEPWHGRALAVTLASGALGQWNIDMSRHAREKLAPRDYARFCYYEKWISALADLLVDRGVVTRAELAGGDARPSDLAARKLAAERVPDVLGAGGPADRPSDIVPVFDVGDRVKSRRITANRLVDGGHTRLPRYAAGAVGRILRYHGTHVLPDSAAHGLGDAAEPLYTVAFPAHELWARPEHPQDEVMLDLWQSYLEPAP